MNKQFKIDWLLVFLLLVLSNLMLLYGKNFLPEFQINNQGLKINTDIDDFIDVDKKRVQNLNPSNELFYSVDGGDTFLSTSEQLDFDELKNKYLLDIPTSYHWCAPMGNFPELKTLVLYVSNEKRNIITDKKHITNLNNYQSELPIVSLILPESNLIDEEEGMMIMGVDSWNNEGFYVNWWERNANYTRRGLKSSSIAHLHYFENDSLQYESDVNIKISGNATRGFPQKSMQIFVDKNADNKMEFPFFGKNGLKKYQSLFLRNSGNDNTKTLFADLLMHQLAEGTHVISQTGRSVVVFLNGNYWGIYNLRERIDLYYLSKIEDCKESEITILEENGNKLKDGDKKEQKNFLNAIEKIENNKMTSEEFSSIFDVANLMDYFFFETFYANTDWPNNNVIVYKKDEGKWKFILHDLDYGLAYLGNDSHQKNMFSHILNSNSNMAVLFQFVLSNFKIEFKKRCQELILTHLNEEVVFSSFNELKRSLEDEIELHNNRWRQLGIKKDWDKNCENNLNFFQARKEIYINQLNEL